MNNVRAKFSDAFRNHLLDEVDALCPICGISLLPVENNEPRRVFEIAHIYPLNPTKEHQKVLPLVKMLGNDINGFENLLATCPTCHTEYDKYFNEDEYNKWKNIKIALKSKRSIKKIFSKFNIEDELSDIINVLSNYSFTGALEQLDYKSLRIDDKINPNIPFIIKKKIKDDVVDYFKFIQNQFYDLSKENSIIFETISSQIKSFYNKCRQEGFTQEEVYNTVSDWLENKTRCKSKRACEIIVAFFIQDCEIF